MVSIRSVIPFVAALAFVIGGPKVAEAAKQPAAKEHVVIQVSDGDTKTWNQALNVVKNLQQAYGKNKVVVRVVAFGNGIGMLQMESVVGTRVQEAMSSGTQIVACQNTMKGHHLTPQDMLSKIGYVPAGVVDIIKKERAGWAVVRP